MKIGLQTETTDWFLNDFNKDYTKHTRHQVTEKIEEADVILANRGKFKTYWNLFKSKGRFYRGKMFLHLHHVVPNKLDKYPFNFYNELIDGCIVPNEITKNMVSKHLTVPVYKVPYWILSKRTNAVDPCLVQSKRRDLATKNEVLIGSYQKDSEGDSNVPKLEKGPDIFLDVVVKLNKIMNIKVVLAGPSRKYLIEGLDRNKVPYVHLNTTINSKEETDVNLLYDCLDWYLITSRFEGGPQSVLEASYRKIKILSTNVGIAPEILNSDCICVDADDFVAKIEKKTDMRQENYNKVLNYIPEIIIPQWDDFFEKIGRE